MSEPDHRPSRPTCPRPAGGADRPLGLLAARHVPLSAEAEQQAVDALAGLPAALIAHQGDIGAVLEVQPGGEVSSPDTTTPTPREGRP